MGAIIPLNTPVAIFIESELLAFARTTMTRHLILSGLGFIVTVNPQDSVLGLRPLDAKPSVHAGGFFIFIVDLNVDLNYIGVNI
jgi:hypothetical protein